MENGNPLKKTFMPFILGIVFYLLSFNVMAQPSIQLDTIYSASCPTCPDGEIWISIIGGTAPYSFYWSNGDTTQDLFSVMSGNYSVTVTDADTLQDIGNYFVPADSSGGCIVMDSMKIGPETGPSMYDGFIDLYPSGGMIPYTYVWDNMGMYDTLTTGYYGGLESGWYYVTIYDSDTCKYIDSYYVNQDTVTGCNISINYDMYPETGIGKQNGMIDIWDVNGGMSPYTFIWSTGDTIWNTNMCMMDSLSSGWYDVTITDSDTCTYFHNFYIDMDTIAKCIVIDSVDIAPETNPGMYDGHIDLFASGGMIPYTYVWDNMGMYDTLTTGYYGGLSEGWYYVTIYDSDTCMYMDSYYVPQDGGGGGCINIMYDMYPETGAGKQDGMIDIWDVNGGMSPYTFIWSTGDTIWNTNMCMMDSLSSGWYDVTITDSDTCTYFHNFYIDMDTIAKCIVIDSVNIAPETNPGMYDGHIDLFVSGGMMPYTYVWDNMGMYDTLTTGYYGGLSEGWYYVTIYDSDTCMYMDSYYVPQDDTTCASFTAVINSNAPVCDGENLDLNEIGGYATTWVWSGPNAFYSTDQNPVISAANSVYTGNYSVTITDGSGCKDIENLFVEVAEPITISYDIYPESNFGMYDGSIDIYSVMGGIPPYTYTWSSGQTSSYIDMLTEGQYDVTVTDTIGCQAFESVWLPVDSLAYNIMADFTFTYGDSMNIVYFADKSTGTITSWHWDFGDNSFSDVANPVHHYLEDGYYTVFLDVFDSLSGSMGYYDTVVYVDVPSDNSVVCQAGFDVEVIGDQASFTNMSSGSITNNHWDFGDGTFSNATDPVHIYINSGYYEVFLDVYDSINDCLSTYSEEIYVEVIGDTTSNCLANFTKFADELTVNFTSNSSGDITNYFWDFGDGAFSYKPNPVHTYDQSGYYLVYFDIFDSVSGCMDSYEKEIFVQSEGDTSQNCLADFTKFVDGLTVNFTDQSLGNATSFYWDFGDGAFSYKPNPVHDYPAAGYYLVYFDIYDTVSGCMDSYEKEIYVAEAGDTLQDCNAEFTKFTDNLEVSFTNKSKGSITHFHWDFGDGTFADIADPLHIYDSTGYYWVVFDVFDSVSGCMDVYEKEIYVAEAGDSVQDCNAQFTKFTENMTVSFNDESKGQVTDYYWDFGDGTYAYVAEPVHQYTEGGYYVVYLDIYDSVTGCMDYFEKEIYVAETGDTIQDCKAEFTKFVDDLDVTFTNKSTGELTNYLWDFGDGKTSIKENPVHNYLKSGYYDVVLDVFDSITGCMASYTKNIYVEAVGDTTQNCNAKFNKFVNGKSVGFTNKSSGNITNYLWEFGDGTNSNIMNPIHTYAKGGYYDVYLTIMDSLTGCQDVYSQHIFIGDTADTTVSCVADFSRFLEDKKATFTDNSIGSITHYYWNFGDGGYASIADPVHNYDEEGYYDVYLSIYDSVSGCQDNITKEILVQLSEDTVVKNNADFSYMINTANNTVSFSDKSKGNVSSWYWTFGDGSFEQAINPTHKYNQPGYYDVCLTTFDGSTGSSFQKCKNIMVGIQTCNISASYSYIIDNNKNKVTLSDNSTGTINSWFWNFGDGVTSTKQAPTHSYSQAGYYLISLAVRDTVNDCVDYYADFIQVGDADCKADFQYTVADTSSNKVDFVDNSKGAIKNYFWLFDDDGYSINSEPQHSYQREGLYNVSLTVIDSSALCVDYIEKEVQVGNVLCNADFSVYVDSASNKAYFTNDIMGESTMLYWVFGDGTISTESNPVHTFTVPGYYTVGLNTYNSNNGCMDYHEEAVLITGQGDDMEAGFIFIVDDANKEVHFRNRSTGGNSYYWNFGYDGESSIEENPVYQYPAGGYYNVCLTAYGSGIMQNTTCKEVKVAPEQEENCKADFFFSVDDATKTVSLVDRSYGNPDTWYWEFDDGDNSTSQNPEHTYTESGYYKVHLKTTNSSTGCSSDHFELVNVAAGNNGLTCAFSFLVDTSNAKASSYPVDFVGISHGDASKLKWNFGDGTYDSTTVSPTHKYTQPGTYEVCLTISDPLTGDLDMQCDSINVGLTDIEEEVVESVNIIRLHNYPNPFSEYTTIRYTTNEDGLVQLAVYGIDGARVATIVNAFKSAGDYRIIWNGNDLPAGIYYLRMVVGDAVKVNKLIIE